jgi:DNA-binding PadR family transcriptional regulator
VKSSKKYLGRFELFVLAATKKLGERAYGAEITRYLSRILNREITVAQVYLALERLQRGDLVRSEFTQPIRQRGGRAKRLFSLTPYGVELLTDTASALRTLIE